MEKLQFHIDSMRPEDWPAVCAIYAEGIATGNATFETNAPEWEKWNDDHLTNPRLVARDTDGTILAWAALVPVSGRCVYAGVAENSIYVAQAARGRGVGKALLMELVTQSEQAGYWTLQCGIFPENVASIAIHKACGFREVGRRERLGQMLNGAWRDVVLLERRSQITGR